MTSPAKLRVIQWATGGVGKAAIECVVNHPQLELVGCWVHSADKNGRDVGEILGTAALAVTATGCSRYGTALRLSSSHSALTSRGGASRDGADRTGGALSTLMRPPRCRSSSAFADAQYLPIHSQARS